MSEFGLKIKNYSAGSLYAYNNGARDQLDYKNSMLTNSLFLDYLLKNGLTSVKNVYTNDIIGIDFTYGSRSFDEEIKHLNNLLEKYKKLDLPESITKIESMIKIAREHPEKYIKATKEKIREVFYRDGVSIKYYKKDKNGNLKVTETIHYKMLMRSTGKAKKGSCIFICDRLYDKAIDFLRMGLTLPDTNAPIVEISAYSPLISSTIVGRVQIEPENILIIKDVDSFFKTTVISVETDENKHCVAKRIEDYQVKNTLFDGQALIDSSIFPEWGNGYILLRHHFCKMAAFSTNIQLFFRDYYGDKYESAKVADMFGNEHFVKDIKLITTDNAMKWLKFDVSYEYWCNRVHENDCMFGIVKTAHKSKLGEVQRMSYQMVNTLSMVAVPRVAQTSIDYINSLKSDDDVFLDYLRHNYNFANDYEVLVALVEQDRDFLRSDYFRSRKRKIIESYVLNFRSGHVVQNGDNLTIVGSPYAMLLATVGEDVEKDKTLQTEISAIQCYTKRFAHDTYLCGFRNPHNSPNNIISLHNMFSYEMDRYFNLGEQCMAVNVIHTDIQDRANGCDFDSDSFYVTDQEDSVAHAQCCRFRFPTIVNNIPKDGKRYDNTSDYFAYMDNNLSAAQRAIGESSNLAQIALTYSYNFDDEKYQDYVCILSVLAQVAIDNAKRRFDVDLVSEIKRIKDDMNVKEYGYPTFWGVVKKDFNKNLINEDLICPMNYLSDVKFTNFKPKESTLSIGEFFIKYELEENRKKCKKVEELIEKYSLDLKNYEDESLVMVERFDELVTDIRKIYLSKTYIGLMSWLIDRAFGIVPQTVGKRNKSFSKTENNKAILLKTLYCVNSKNLLKCFSKNVTTETL